MKRFLLFYGPIGEATGGWDDFASDHDSIEHATAEAEKQKRFADWWHVVDTATGEYVANAPDGFPVH